MTYLRTKWGRAVWGDSSLIDRMVKVIGIPLDENSSFLRGPARAPAYIREALQCGSGNMCVEDGRDLAGKDMQSHWQDVGDMQLGPMPQAFEHITAGIAALLKDDNEVLSLGGDHSITFPIIRAFAQRYPRLNILHIDAHGDLYDDFEGNHFSHACPFARIMEAGLASRLVQVGIRTANPHQREQARRFGVEVIEMKDWTAALQLRFDGPAYLSLDLDGLDPAHAPGVSHHEPGGLTVREVLHLLQQTQAQWVGADIVELNPARDVNNMTAMVAAKFYKELVAKMLD